MLIRSLPTRRERFDRLIDHEYYRWKEYLEERHTEPVDGVYRPLFLRILTAAASVHMPLVVSFTADVEGMWLVVYSAVWYDRLDLASYEVIHELVDEAAEYEGYTLSPFSMVHPTGARLVQSAPQHQ